jgi:hypothetical protein
LAEDWMLVDRLLDDWLVDDGLVADWPLVVERLVVPRVFAVLLVVVIARVTVVIRDAWLSVSSCWSL